MFVLIAAALLQTVNTASIRGTVSPGDAHVTVTNTATGSAVETDAHHGRFTVHGLESGGPYRVQVRRLGFAPKRLDGVVVGLGQRVELDFQLSPAISSLDTVRVAAASVRATGLETTISDLLLHALPTLNRDMYDFVRVSPYVSTKAALPGGGLSGAGANLRFDNYLIDGATDRFVTGNSATATQGGKSVPIDAVKEYQILLAPADVRYGDFAGALVNAVTKSGTNALHASGFVYQRSDALEGASDAPYQRTQFGFSAAGPIVRDRLHFVVASEFQRLDSPALGPYLGQAPSATPSVPVAASDVERFAALMRGWGLDAGSGGAVTTGTPLTNLFGRLDLALPTLRSRAVLLDSYARTDNIAFTRAATDTFSLSSYRASLAFASQLTSLQIHTYLPAGIYNAFILSNRLVTSDNRPDVREPIILVSVPSTGGVTAILKAGSQESTQGVSTRSRSLALTNDLSIPLAGSHELVLGGQMEWIRLQRGGLNGSYGTWKFNSLDALRDGIADRYSIKKDFGSVSPPTNGGQYALYVGDDWRAGGRVELTVGLRLDGFALWAHAPYNPRVDSLFGRRTDQMALTAAPVSPRIGIAWDAFGDGRDRFRAGAGIFTGRIPPAWANSAVYSYGTGTGTLTCGSSSSDQGRPPAFVPDYRAAPTACTNNVGIVLRGDVDLIDRHLRMAQTARGWVGYDRRLPWNMTATAEASTARGISDFVFVNLNLVGPQGTDPHNRVMYGTVTSQGVGTPKNISDYSEVIDLRNVSANHSFQADARLEKEFASGTGVVASYTFTRVRDVQLPLRAGAGAGTQNWATGRVVSGRHDDLSTGVSTYDIPHRVVVAGTYRAPWRRLTTDMSLYYVGESGSPFTYIASGLGGRGDLNADGARNDPLYIPKTALDTTEIAFSGNLPGGDNSPTAMAQRIASQRSAFEQFISSTRCFERQRGSIMKRNSCREPWSHTSIASIRQTLPSGAHGLSVQADLFNVLNALNRRWGHYLVSDPNLLEQVGETPAAAGVAQQPIFHFDATKPRWTTLPTESSYQFQLGVRYTF